jgi:hypothetical protein
MSQRKQNKEIFSSQKLPSMTLEGRQGLFIVGAQKMIRWWHAEREVMDHH